MHADRSASSGKFRETRNCARDTRYEEVIRKSNFFFFFTLLIFKELRCVCTPINNSKLFHSKERSMTIIRGYRTSENPTFSLYRSLNNRVTCTRGRFNSKFLHLKSQCLAVSLQMSKERNILLLLLEKRYTNIFFSLSYFYEQCVYA